MEPLGLERWWPEGLGEPSTAGGQDGLRFAVFPDKRRLLVERNGRRTTYDLGDHRIAGVQSQAQGGGPANITFSSQHGPVRLDDLTIVGDPDEHQSSGDPQRAPEPRAQTEPFRRDHARSAAEAATPTGSSSGAQSQHERVVFSEEGHGGSFIKLVVGGTLDGELIEAAEDFLRRQRRRLLHR